MKDDREPCTAMDAHSPNEEMKGDRMPCKDAAPDSTDRGKPHSEAMTGDRELRADAAPDLADRGTPHLEERKGARELRTDAAPALVDKKAAQHIEIHRESILIS